MSTASKLKRYALILEKVQQSGHPSFEELAAFLRNAGVQLSGRTLQRYIGEIKYEFGVLVEYDKKRNGYYIEESDLSRRMIRFIQQQSVAVSLQAFLKEHPEQAGAVIAGDEVQVKGSEYIGPVLTAISERRTVRLVYQKFLDDRSRTYRLQPYGLKEFLNRWYAVGRLEGKPGLTTFGLDRVLDMELTAEIFTRDKTIDIKAYFSRMIGIHAEDGDAEIIRLWFSRLQAQYMKTVPLHHSQKLISEDESGTVFEYVLIANYELQQKILSYGHQVRVVSPAWLVKEHRHMLQCALDNYGKKKSI